MPGPEGQRDQAARPALATAGALVLAVAFLQIAQQVIGVFSPRPSIQAALVIAVGLAALTAERKRATLHGSLDKVGVISGVVCIAALGATGVIWVTSGFSTPPKPSLGAQVDRIRDGLRAKGYAVTYRQLRLHPGLESYLFIAGRPKQDANRRPSDTVLIYDNDRGTLKRRLDFRPTVTMPDQGNAAVGAAFHLASVDDLDGDGQKELLGSWDTNLAGTEYQRVPVLISRRSDSNYAVTPLLSQASVHDAPTQGLLTYGFGPTGRPSPPSVWVSDLSLDTSRAFLPRNGTLATSVVTSHVDPQLTVTAVPADAFGRRVAGTPRVIRFWTIDMSGARPQTRALCILGPGSTRLPVLPVPQADFGSTAYLGHPLASALRSAGAGLGEWHDGLCGDAAS